MKHVLREVSGKEVKPERWVRLHFKRGLERHFIDAEELMHGEFPENDCPVEWITSGGEREVYLRPVSGIVVSVEPSSPESYSLQVFDSSRQCYVVVESSDCRKICIQDITLTRWLNRQYWVDDTVLEVA